MGFDCISYYSFGLVYKPRSSVHTCFLLYTLKRSWYSWPRWVNAGNFFFFFCVPKLYLRGSHFAWDFCMCDCLKKKKNPTIDVVTFHLCGCRWCTLDVFLLLACTSLGHECHDLLSLWYNAYVHRLDHRLYYHPKVFEEWSQNPS